MEKNNQRYYGKTINALYIALVIMAISIGLGVGAWWFFVGLVYKEVSNHDAEYQSHLTQLVQDLRPKMIFFILASAFLMGIFTYIMFRIKDKRIIRQAKEFSSIVENAPVGIYTIRPNGIIESFNPKMVEISGSKDASQRIGLNVFELHSYKESGLDKLFQKGLEGKSFETEVGHTSQDNKRTFRHYYGMPIFDNKSKAVERLLLIVEDVTEQKRLRSELEKYSKRLEATVAERTKELEEKLFELSRVNQLMVDRELKMIELKEENKKLKENKG